MFDSPRLFRRSDPDFPITPAVQRRLMEAGRVEGEGPTTQAGWLRLSEAALDAGVTTATIIKWAECRELERIADRNGWRYPGDAVRARARAYWRTSRFRRATPPQWLGAEDTR